MGCNNCKQKKGTQKSQKKSTGEKVGNIPVKEIPIIPGIDINGEFSGNILLKLVTFIILIGALPLIFIVLLLQVFTTFFLPNFTVKKGFMGVVRKILRKFTAFRIDREIKKRDKEFRDNIGYEDLDIYSIEEEEEITK